jgi:hypothetical protein
VSPLCGDALQQNAPRSLLIAKIRGEIFEHLFESIGQIIERNLLACQGV